MSRGLPYDSDAGRAYAGAVTALMTGNAYVASARLSARIGPFDEYEKNREAMLSVIEKHRQALQRIDASLVPDALFTAAANAWDEAVSLGTEHGYRNAQVSVLAPTGTIAFMMDCDTTGVEPDIALVSYKRLVGGGMIRMVNRTVPLALKTLGYSQDEIEEIVAYIDQDGIIEGAPHLKDEHLAVFDCALRPAKGTRCIAPLGHVRMMGAIQPFISGAISKTVNLPNESAVDNVMETFIEAWRHGLKAIAIYRDGSKRMQPVTTTKAAAAPAAKPVRRRLPDTRHSITHKFSIEGHEGYITVGTYEDGSPGEIFITMAKEGSTISGMMDAFATSISLTLQYGVPLKDLVNKFGHMRFEPAGMTQNREIPVAQSVVDYVFRWLGSQFLGEEEKAELGILSETVRARLEADYGKQGEFVIKPNGHNGQDDAPPCMNCGWIMTRSGTCYRCENCGSTSGCS